VDSLNLATTNAAEKAVVAVAAGNSNQDACRFSPSSAAGSRGVLSVGATTTSDARYVQLAVTYARAHGDAIPLTRPIASCANLRFQDIKYMHLPYWSARSC